MMLVCRHTLSLFFTCHYTKPNQGGGICNEYVSLNLGNTWRIRVPYCPISLMGFAWKHGYNCMNTEYIYVLVTLNHRETITLSLQKKKNRKKTVRHINEFFQYHIHQLKKCWHMLRSTSPLPTCKLVTWIYIYITCLWRRICLRVSEVINRIRANDAGVVSWHCSSSSPLHQVNGEKIALVKLDCLVA